MMKMSILITLSILTTISLADTIDIDAKIDAIDKASTPQERVKLVNEFKVLLANMNENDRVNAISQLQTSMVGSNKHLEKNNIQNHINQTTNIQNNISQQMIERQDILPQSISHTMNNNFITPANSNNGARIGNIVLPIKH